MTPLPERLALFGGTFDPPHVGHFIVAWDVIEALDLDEFWFVPSAIPPHKQDTAVTPGALRAEMLEAGLESSDRPRVSVSRIELERQGPSFTVDTLRRVRRDCPDAEIYFVMGMDQVVDFGSWKEPEEIARLARLVAVGRGGELPDAGPAMAAPFRSLQVTRIDVSSTDIRRRVREGRSIRYLVPDPVRRIIEAQGLYKRG